MKEYSFLNWAKYYQGSLRLHNKILSRLYQGSIRRYYQGSIKVLEQDLNHMKVPKTSTILY
jgi:hypothetical protein